jgi:hypothetical protein
MELIDNLTLSFFPFWVIKKVHSFMHLKCTSIISVEAFKLQFTLVYIACAVGPGVNTLGLN